MEPTVEMVLALWCDNPGRVAVYRSLIHSPSVMVRVVRSRGEMAQVLSRELIRGYLVDADTLAGLSREDQQEIEEMRRGLLVLRGVLDARESRVRLDYFGVGERSWQEFWRDCLTAKPRAVRLHRRHPLGRSVVLSSESVGGLVQSGIALNGSEDGLLVRVSQPPGREGEWLGFRWDKSAAGEPRPVKVVRLVSGRQAGEAVLVAVRFWDGLEERPPPPTGPADPGEGSAGYSNEVAVWLRRGGLPAGGIRREADLKVVLMVEKILGRRNRTLRTADAALLDQVLVALRKRSVRAGRLEEMRKVLSGFYDVLLREGLIQIHPLVAAEKPLTLTDPVPESTGPERLVGQIDDGQSSDGVEQAPPEQDLRHSLAEVKARLERIQDEVSWLRLRVDGYVARLDRPEEMIGPAGVAPAAGGTFCGQPSALGRQGSDADRTALERPIRPAGDPERTAVE